MNVKNFDEELLEEQWKVHHSCEKPYDSWDRLFALYIIDSHPELLGKEWEEVKDNEDMQDFCIHSGFEGSCAYDNYEREWLSDENAFRELMKVAVKGREAVLEDSYEDDGWFGAS